MSFEGRVAVVFGGGSGIGAAVATAFASNRACVVVADVNGEGAGEVAERIGRSGGSCHAVSVDITDEAVMEACMADIVARHGRIDHLVASAGVSSRHTIAQMSAESWRRVIDVNLTGAFLAIKFAQEPIAAGGGGSISVISSVAAEHIAYQSGAHYAASKSALTGLVRHAAFELGRRQIRVNAVGPGPMTNRMGGGETEVERRRATIRNLPLQRMVEPSDVANVCLFLASPAARAITGVYLPVDNGFLTGRGAAYARYFEAHEEAF